ncbi:cellulase family protein [Colletotrichum kahawae]|uniref:Cellulase family protein n=1 Tax=Colletotrichum kahawae TaxID=34407 RepID=A0AAD9YPE8_COLKA|nr:cellulase family protein [Colletotrichum kahawae]
MRRLLHTTTTALLSALALPFTSALSPPAPRDAQPLPLSVIGRHILDAKNETVALVGVNWPGHEQTMLPEGLQFQNISHIVTKIAETGFNSVRLTFATEMVDDIVDKGGDITIKATLEKALGAENGTKVMKQIVSNNPGFSESTKRLEVWNAVAEELACQNIYLHLDNHVSKAGWCCDISDGNGWFGDAYFNTSNWIRGLSFMAEHGKANWKSFSSIGLRNEIRERFSYDKPPAAPAIEPQTWERWEERMVQGANAIHNANPDVLIFFGGRLGGIDIEAPANGRYGSEPKWNFSIAELPFKRKFVFELHQYDHGLVTDCEGYYGTLDDWGADVMNAGQGNMAPLIMSEWGHSQSDADREYEKIFRKCLMGLMVQRSVGWMVWTIGGSYYIREGKADFEEPWGLLDHTWSDYRGRDSIKKLQVDIKATYQSFNRSMPAAAKDVGGLSGAISSG